MINIDQIRHPKENTYFIIMAAISALVYLGLLIIFILAIIASFGLTFIAFFIWLFFVAIGLWWGGQVYKAKLYGNSVHINQSQYKELHDIVLRQSAELGITPPPVFVQSSEGKINAFATRVFLSRYIILESGIVDLLLSTKRFKEVEMVIGHELGHHVAGHLSYSKKMLIAFGRIIPFVSMAYSRACELTCDRVGYLLCGDLVASQQALFSLALGSNVLLKSGDMNAFISQEDSLPEIAAFFNKISSTHPRLTFRVKELRNYAHLNRNAMIR